MTDANLTRFDGFAALYDAARPEPPRALGALFCAYARSPRPRVVDLGSGTGISSRWAASWAASVIGIEPNDDMRAVAVSRPAPKVEYRGATSARTGLDATSADVVLAVQSLHWMDPGPTFAEVARVLRPGGVFAALDGDWPPVWGSAQAERAWIELERRIEALERRRGRGARSFGKEGHLGRMAASGLFTFTREVVVDGGLGDGSGADAGRFIDLARSQGSYQGLRRAGVTDEELGLPEFEDAVRAGSAGRPAPFPLSISWRARVGIAG